ncbi:non-specific lipid transfer protein GPI-anchored 25 [Oryza sativa Japonica Group]|uniref:non-specific lipid transfer protein GPI-anchored 25 n=1 Tax=Oryza sativa subsp. japonica TaxID=39947 RepID=UPI00077546A1|nr:uncharacterized protein LOC107280841 [Oryza sativa Japonica Group]
MLCSRGDPAARADEHGGSGGGARPRLPGAGGGVVATAAASAAGAFLEVPPATPCAVAIVSVAPCLAHVAVVAPPVRPVPAPTEARCAAFLRGVSPSGGGGEGCFCHLLRNSLLGFPVNTARLGALLPTCAIANANASADSIVEAATLFADTYRGHYRGCGASGLGQEGGEEQVGEWRGRRRSRTRCGGATMSPLPMSLLLS